MTIIEALKSGKPYRRGDNPWITPSEIKSHVYLTGLDILATDWEVKEEKELKPCAHCGSGDVTLAEKEPDFGDRNSFFVICQCGIRTSYYILLKDAIAAWNMRVESPELAQLREQIKLRDEALVELRKEYDNDHRKAFIAGQHSVQIILLGGTSVGCSAQLESKLTYDEWKRGQK